MERLLNMDFQRRIGGDLTDKQRDRLTKTVKHYMNEVYAKNPGESIQKLNKEVLTSVVPDYMGYLRRNAGPVSEADETTDSTGLRLDVNSRFDQIQNDRQERRVGPPPPLIFGFPWTRPGPPPCPSLSRFGSSGRKRLRVTRRL